MPTTIILGVMTTGKQTEGKNEINDRWRKEFLTFFSMRWTTKQKDTEKDRGEVGENILINFNSAFLHSGLFFDERGIFLVPIYTSSLTLYKYQPSHIIFHRVTTVSCWKNIFIRAKCVNVHKTSEIRGGEGANKDFVWLSSKVINGFNLLC